MKITVKDVFEFINGIAPFDTQESWDNSGLLVGKPDAEVKKIAFALDPTISTLNKAAEDGANLLITHHPVIFDPLKSVLSDTVVFEAIKKDIAIISAHTCWDIAQGGVNDVLAGIIGLTDITPIVPDENGNCMLRKGELKTAVPAEEFADIVSVALDTVVRVSSPEKLIKTVAVCGGSGASMLSALKAEGIDAYVTGDAKHNDFLDAIDLDIALLAAGHYETETVSMPVLKALVSEEYPDIPASYIEDAPVKYIG